MRRLYLLLPGLALALISHSGCEMLPHSLQPEQLWKLNRQPPMDVRFQSPDESDAVLRMSADAPAADQHVKNPAAL